MAIEKNAPQGASPGRPMRVALVVAGIAAVSA